MPLNITSNAAASSASYYLGKNQAALQKSRRPRLYFFSVELFDHLTNSVPYGADIAVTNLGRLVCGEVPAEG